MGNRCHIIKNQNNQYLKRDDYGNITVTKNRDNALTLDTVEEAKKTIEDLPDVFKLQNWKIKDVNLIGDEGDIVENITPVPNELAEKDFDISKFFINTINCISQLKSYAKNMRALVKECEDKILDIRHYKRDEKTKLNAIQLQRLEQYEISIERERYKYKSNHIIAEIFLADFSRLSNKGYIKVIENVKQSEYKPRVLTYESLDNIVGRNTPKIHD